jgi:hypothetical protein
VVVENCFLRNNDDEICVKTHAPGQPSEDIMVRNCVVWNERARGLGIVAETRRDISRVTFQDCDIIHDFSDNQPNSYECAALGILVSDSGTMRDIRFENIRVNDVRQLIHCWIGQDMWGRDAQRGHVDGVLFKDITVSGRDFPKSHLLGYDATHLIENVAFDNLRILGKTILSQQDGRISSNAFVRNLRFHSGD